MRLTEVKSHNGVDPWEVKMSKYLPVTLRTAAILIAFAGIDGARATKVYGITMAQPYTWWQMVQRANFATTSHVQVCFRLGRVQVPCYLLADQ